MIKWESATSDVMKECKFSGFYNSGKVRGRGVWFEGENIIVNTGKTVFENGKKRTSKSDYIYTKGFELDLKYDGECATWFEAKKLCDIFELLPIASNLEKAVFGGWCFSAIVAGGLEWRPHVWLNAPSGSGKSWIFNKIISPFFGNTAVKVTGEETTEAGIRQEVKFDSTAVIHDEAEGKSEAGKRNLQKKLMLARMSSTESTAKILKGTVGGKSNSFLCRSQFLFISTTMPEIDRADVSRISVIGLVSSKKRVDPTGQFNKLKSLVAETMSEQYASSMRTRAIKMLPVIKETARILNDVINETVKSQRNADQYAPLLAGWWCMQNDNIPTDVEAQMFVMDMDIPVYDHEDTEEQKCLDVILSLIPKEWDVKSTIGQALQKLSDFTSVGSCEKKELEMIGIGFSKKRNAGNPVILSRDLSRTLLVSQMFGISILAGEQGLIPYCLSVRLNGLYRKNIQFYSTGSGW